MANSSMEGRDLETPDGIKDLAKRVVMEAPNEALPNMWNFIRNLPAFTVLFLLGITKGEASPSFELCKIVYVFCQCLMI